MTRFIKAGRFPSLSVYWVILSAGLFGFTWLAGLGVAVNSSASMPRGIYVTQQIGTVFAGELVSLCVSDPDSAALYQQRGYLRHSSRCRSGLPPLLKPVAGVPGDLVQISELGTSINGKLATQSRVFDTDSQGKEMKHLPVGWSRKLGDDEYFVLANHVERSLDSRYYGPVHHADLISQAYPFLTE